MPSVKWISVKIGKDNAGLVSVTGITEGGELWKCWVEKRVKRLGGSGRLEGVIWGREVRCEPVVEDAGTTGKKEEGLEQEEKEEEEEEEEKVVWVVKDSGGVLVEVFCSEAGAERWVEERKRNVGGSGQLDAEGLVIEKREMKS